MSGNLLDILYMCYLVVYNSIPCTYIRSEHYALLYDSTLIYVKMSFKKKKGKCAICWYFTVISVCCANQHQELQKCRQLANSLKKSTHLVANC